MYYYFDRAIVYFGQKATSRVDVRDFEMTASFGRRIAKSAAAAAWGGPVQRIDTICYPKEAKGNLMAFNTSTPGHGGVIVISNTQLDPEYDRFAAGWCSGEKRPDIFVYEFEEDWNWAFTIPLLPDVSTKRLADRWNGKTAKDLIALSQKTRDWINSRNK